MYNQTDIYIYSNRYGHVNIYKQNSIENDYDKWDEMTVIRTASHTIDQSHQPKWDNNAE